MAAKQTVSKEEMDELSHALEAADGSADRDAEVRDYDFIHPDKLSRANLRALELVFLALERSWSRTLAGALRREVEVRVNPLEQTSLGDYSETLPSPGLIFSLSMSPLPGRTLVDMQAGLALSIVERMAGGIGNAPTEPRPLTQIECGIARRLMNRLASDLSDAWKPVAQLAVTVPECFSSAEEIEMDAGELMVAVGIVWSIDSAESRVNIAVPLSSLDSILEDLDPRRWMMAEMAQSGNAGPSVSDLLRVLDVPLSVELGHTRVSVQDVLGMEAGDVVRLDAGVNDPLAVKIGGRVRFHARPGLRGNRISIQMTGDSSAAMSVEDAQAIDKAA